MSISAIGPGQSSWAQQVQQVGGSAANGHGGMRKAGMDAAATALGMTPDGVRSALGGGQSLSSLAQAKGISAASLASTVSAALSSANPSLSSARAEQIADRMISGPSSDARGAAGVGDADHDGDSH
ncbi:hypothetical protein [Cellulomonas sp. P24]|uniref:hypothetical protein n=1 Tax=Cellulomonas sp. P24 TaxID=2885206 RepID=UPI00216B1043|nr:hypothetical protein [Cellulomonas sp. P24]MCR6493233.1 hypothetical protein [Cellulomonas sp. P24]